MIGHQVLLWRANFIKTKKSKWDKNQHKIMLASVAIYLPTLTGLQDLIFPFLFGSQGFHRIEMNIGRITAFLKIKQLVRIILEVFLRLEMSSWDIFIEVLPQKFTCHLQNGSESSLRWIFYGLWSTLFLNLYLLYRIWVLK